MRPSDHIQSAKTNNGDPVEDVCGQTENRYQHVENCGDEIVMRDCGNERIREKTNGDHIQPARNLFW